MPSRERKGAIVLAPRAKQDFIDILRHTGEKWGQAQLLVYRDKIDGALRTIARNPTIGHHSPLLPDTHRVYAVGSHVVVYRELDAQVAVVRILHQRMSLGRHI